LLDELLGAIRRSDDAPLRRTLLRAQAEAEAQAAIHEIPEGVLEVGAACWYAQKGGAVLVTVVGVSYESEPPSYAVQMAGGAQCGASREELRRATEAEEEDYEMVEA